MSAPLLTARWIDATAIGREEHDRWSALFDAAGTNPFAAPWFVCPVLALAGGRLLVVVDDDGRWHGVLPVEPA